VGVVVGGDVARAGSDEVEDCPVGERLPTDAGVLKDIDFSRDRTAEWDKAEK